MPYKGPTAYLLGYPEETVAALERTLALLGDEAGRSRTHYFLGRAYWQLGDPTRAKAHLSKFLESLDREGRQTYLGGEAARLVAVISSPPSGGSPRSDGRGPRRGPWRRR